MDSSGDNNDSLSPRSEVEQTVLSSDNNEFEETGPYFKQDVITPETINENESKLKDRIALCRNVIQSLKFELNEEKTRLQIESNTYLQDPIALSTSSAASGYKDMSNSFLDDLPTATSVSDVCLDSKLNCDQNLIEYEKQLLKYQSTLHMAQLEKKNAIRKQMLAKAYRLKLLEVENQCNIELLRVKQSLQCLEPLKMIANKWKTNTEDVDYDYNNIKLIPRYPDLSTTSGSERNYFKDDSDEKLKQPENNVKDEACAETE